MPERVRRVQACACVRRRTHTHSRVPGFSGAVSSLKEVIPVHCKRDRVVENKVSVGKINFIKCLKSSVHQPKLGLR